MDLDIRHNEEAKRFETTVDSMTAFLTYRCDDARMVVEHTEVPSKLEGLGIGGALVRAALDHARATSLKVVPVCPFAKAYIAEHPDDAAGVAESPPTPEQMAPPSTEDEVIDEASLESFPASDPPSTWARPSDPAPSEHR